MGGCQLGETIDSIGESMVKPAVTVAYNWPFIVQRCGGNKSLLMCISCAVVGSHIVSVFVEPLLGSEISQVCMQPNVTVLGVVLTSIPSFTQSMVFH